ncbi:MAG: hypothetical protein ACXU8U_05125 [Asticcacaulis sp.]
MHDQLLIAVLVVVCVMAAIEMTVYAYWRDRLYELYLDYYNRKTHPLVPEAWRAVGGAYTIDFFLEWKMFFSPLSPDMGPDLIRRIKRQKAIVVLCYFPVTIFLIWAADMEVYHRWGYGLDLSHFNTVCGHVLSYLPRMFAGH